MMRLKRIFILMMVLLISYEIALSSEAKITLLYYSPRDLKDNPKIKMKSQGIPTVPVAQVVYLKAESSIGEIVGYKWWLEPPPGSKASFSNPTIPDPILVPDLEGQYQIKLQVTSRSGMTRKASLWLTAAGFVGDGLLVKTGSEAECIKCHEEKVKTWKSTPHAHHSRQDAEGMANLESGQCESCHGPGSQHLGKLDKNQISSSLTPGVCVVCHDSDPNSTLFHEWSHSSHAFSLSTPQKRETKNQPGCSLCHVTQRYWETILNKKGEGGPYTHETGITCSTCHDPHDSTGKDSLLRVGKADNVCTGCHDQIVINEGFFFMAHPNGSVVKGTAGVSITGEVIPSGKHSQVKKNCVGCHMAKPSSLHKGGIGGHTFRVLSKDKENPILNTKACLDCHKTMDLNLLKSSQEEIKKLLKTLADLLPQKENRKKPKLPKDESLSEIQAKASFNYYVILADNTYGLHNPGYVKKLLETSIEALKTENNSGKNLNKPGSSN
jgi:predicted CXXCH cytochrome family protein